MYCSFRFSPTCLSFLSLFVFYFLVSTTTKIRTIGDRTSNSNRIWDVRTGKVVTTIKLRKSGYLFLAWSPGDPNILAAVHQDSETFFVDIQKQKSLKTLSSRSERVGPPPLSLPTRHLIPSPRRSPIRRCGRCGRVTPSSSIILVSPLAPMSSNHATKCRQSQ